VAVCVVVLLHAPLHACPLGDLRGFTFLFPTRRSLHLGGHASDPRWLSATLPLRVRELQRVG